MHKQYITVAFGAVLTVVLGGTLVPLFQLLPFPALRAIVLAPVYGACGWTILQRVNLRYPMVLFATIIGLLIGMFMPWLFPITVASGVLAELLGLGSSRLKASLFPALQFPMMWFATAPTGFTIGTAVFLGATTLVGILLGLGGCSIAALIHRRIYSSAR